VLRGWRWFSTFSGMEDASKRIDDSLFAKMPKDIKALQKRARKETRLKQRAQWAAANPDRLPPKI